MSTLRLRQAGHPPNLTGNSERTRGPRVNRERWLIGLALLGILAWGWIGVDRTVIEQLSGEVPMYERRAFAAQGPSLPLLPAPVYRDDPVDEQSAGGPASELVVQGKAVFEANGCYACHALDGSTKIGPSLLGVWGTEQALNNGSSAFMDDAYFRESVLEPQAKIVQGFVDAAMPSYADLVSDDDLDALAAYIQSLQ